MARALSRGARRLVRRLRRALTWRGLGTSCVVAISMIVIVVALYAPTARTNVFRTDPVLRAMGVSDGAVAGRVAAVEPVQSLSVSPRFVLPMVRDAGKRILAAAPLPAAAPVRMPVPERAIAAAPGVVATPPAAPPVALAVPLEAVVRTPPAAIAKPRPPTPPLTTAVLLTPLLPRTAPVAPPGGAMLAIVLEDLGPAAGPTRRAIALPRPVTLSFLPYAADLGSLTASAEARGHEVYLHLPMEPIGDADPGPNAILVGLEPDDFQHRLTWAFDRVPRARGLNNHMGSRATSDPASMLKVLQEVRRRGLDFVDSRTSPLSIGDGLADQLGIPHAARDVFLDNVPSTAAIIRQLAEAEHLARRRGHALAIGHPYPATLSVLEAWIPSAEARGLHIVRAGDLIARGRCRGPETLTVSACTGPACPPAPAC